MLKPARPIQDLTERDLARFSAKVDKTGECWEWTGAKSSDGYGLFSLDGLMVRAHRVALAIAGRAAPPDGLVDHMCRNRLCVKSDHLRVVDNRTNLLENSASAAHLNAVKTHCPLGHEFAGENLIFHQGSRRCRICKNASMREYRARRKAGVQPNQPGRPKGGKAA